MIKINAGFVIFRERCNLFVNPIIRIVKLTFIIQFYSLVCVHYVVCIFVVIGFISVHFYDSPALFISENFSFSLDHFVVDIINARNTF